MVPEHRSKNLAIVVVEIPIVVKFLSQVFAKHFPDYVLALPPTEEVNSAAAF